MKTNDTLKVLAAALLAPLFAMLAQACGGAGGRYAESGGASEETSAVDATGGEAEYTGADGQSVQPEVLTGDDRSVVDDYGTNMEGYEGDFGQALELTTPNCDRAGELRDAICDLANRICDIADRHGDDDEVRDKCDNGRGRCERARESVDDRCG